MSRERTGERMAWERTRASVTHDWLSGKHYLGKLLHWKRVIEGDIEDPGYAETAALSVVAEWRAKRGTIAWLLDHCESDASPRILIERDQLLNLQGKDKALVAALVHCLWLRREHVAERLESVHSCLADAEARFAAFEGEPRGGQPVVAAQQLSALIQSLRALRDAVRELPARIGVA
jgi:hypothetical protein